METAIKLTPRQYELRRYLEAHTDVWTSSKTIAENVAGYDAKDAYKQINQDYHAINSSGIFDKKIIPSRVKGYKLATKEEFERWAKREYASSIRKIVYVQQQVKDARLDGQEIIPGIEGYQREFYDKFVKENSKMTNEKEE